MTFDNMMACVEILKNIAGASGMVADNGDLTVLNFQRGANGPIEQKVRLVVDYSGYEVAIELMPKRGENDGR